MTETSCSYCGNTFAYRKEPLGRSLCSLCVNLLRNKYAHTQLTYLASEFHVGRDAIKSWAEYHRLQRQRICVNCGREFDSKSNSGGLCPVCALAHRPN